MTVSMEQVADCAALIEKAGEWDEFVSTARRLIRRTNNNLAKLDRVRPDLKWKSRGYRSPRKHFGRTWNWRVTRKAATARSGERVIIIERDADPVFFPDIRSCVD